MFLVDLLDYFRVKKYYWYVVQNYVHKGSGNKISLHRYLLNAPKDYVVDHWNHNTVDNRRINLRLCTRVENHKNIKIFVTNTTGCPCVERNGNGYCVRVWDKGKRYYLGNFKTLEKAMEVRREWDIKHGKRIFY
jgi:hypothetical protein